MKHEKYYTFDGNIEVWPVDEIHIAAMAHLTDKGLTHRRRIAQADGSRLGLATYRSNKDEHLSLFEQLNVPGFTEILPGSGNEKHGKHSWDLHDSEVAISRLIKEAQQIDQEAERIAKNIVQLEVNKTQMQVGKELAIQQGDTSAISMYSRNIAAINSTIAGENKNKIDLSAEKIDNAEEQVIQSEKKTKADEGLAALEE